MFRKTVDSVLGKMGKLQGQLNDLANSKFDRADELEAAARQLVAESNAERHEARRALRVAERIKGLTE